MGFVVCKPKHNAVSTSGEYLFIFQAGTVGLRVALPAGRDAASTGAPELIAGAGSMLAVRAFVAAVRAVRVAVAHPHHGQTLPARSALELKR